MKKILVTGAAGFIGMHACLKLLKNNIIIGVDNLSPYYDVNLKKKRLDILKKEKNFLFYKLDICNNKKLNLIFKKTKPDLVVHLAAVAGVRHSITNPSPYIQTNLVGFANIIHLSKIYKVKHFVNKLISVTYETKFGSI